MQRWWRAYVNVPLIWKILIGFVLGVVAGLVFGPSIQVIQPLGTLFIRLLSMLVMPLILFTLISGAASIAPQNLGRVGSKVVGYYLMTSAFAITVGLFFALLVSPGTGISLGTAKFEAPKTQPIADVLLNIVPTNPFASLNSGQALGVIFFALLVGITLSQLKSSGSKEQSRLATLVLDVVQGLNEALFLVTNLVLQYAPVGVLALIAVVVGPKGLGILLPLAKLIIVVYGGCLLMVGVYSMLMRLFGVPVGRFFRGARDAMATAFVTRSSNGTLPVTMESAEKIGVPRSIYGFSLPLGATINMDGTAVYMGAAAVFAANVVGINLSLTQILSIVLVGTLASIGTAGVPGAGLIMLSMVLTQVGLPLSVVGLIAGIDVVLDMVRTMVNVTGDLVGSAIVAKNEGQLDTGGDPKLPLSAD